MNTTNRKILNRWVRAAALAALVLGVGLPGARAEEPVNKSLFSGQALKGYDPVAYFKAGKPVKGQPEFKYDWKGAKWLFSSAENREAFAKNPDQYAPQYGGYCAKAMSEGSLADISPDAWKIVGDKLYLNYDQRVQKIWEENYPERIQKADNNWSKLRRGEK